LACPERLVPAGAARHDLGSGYLSRGVPEAIAVALEGGGAIQKQFKGIEGLMFSGWKLQVFN
jgi:hypothetical protein